MEIFTVAFCQLYSTYWIFFGRLELRWVFGGEVFGLCSLGHCDSNWKGAEVLEDCCSNAVSQFVLGVGMSVFGPEFEVDWRGL